MRIADRLISALDKKLERFDPIRQAAHGAGGLRSRYRDRTGVAEYREWRGVRDTLFDYSQWLRNLGSIAAMLASAPAACLKGLREYRWLGSYLGAFMLIDRLTEGCRGYELRAAHCVIHAAVRSLTRELALVLSNDKRLGGGPLSGAMLPMSAALPPLFAAGFKGLVPVPLQELPELVGCCIDQRLGPYYIGAAEARGLPSGLCPRSAADAGIAIDDAFPVFGRAFLTANLPCEAQTAVSRLLSLSLGLPDIPVALGRPCGEPCAREYSARALEGAIAFIEERYDLSYDWGALLARAREINRQSAAELELRSALNDPYSALGGSALLLYSLLARAAAGGRDGLTARDARKLTGLMRRACEERREPLGGRERHRALLCGVPAAYYPDFPTWLQNCWGIRAVPDAGLAAERCAISSAEPREALTELARFLEREGMRRGTDASAAERAENLGCDIVLFTGSAECKALLGVPALLEERARERGLHFIFVGHGVENSRAAPRQDMRSCVSRYMSAVLGEQPLDPTLVEFDDSRAY